MVFVFVFVFEFVLVFLLYLYLYLYLYLPEAVVSNPLAMYAAVVEGEVELVTRISVSHACLYIYMSKLLTQKAH